MSGHKGLDKWFKQDWVDIGSKKKGGGFKNVVENLLQGVKENTLNVFLQQKLLV